MQNGEFSIMLLLDGGFSLESIDTPIHRAEKGMNTNIDVRCRTSISGLKDALKGEVFDLYLTTGRTYNDDLSGCQYVKCFSEVCDIVKAKHNGLGPLVYVHNKANFFELAKKTGVKVWEKYDLTSQLVNYFSKLR
jgi:hypothetical protein